MFSGLSTSELISMVSRGNSNEKDYAAGYAQALVDLVKDGIISEKIAAEKLDLTEEAIKMLAK